MAMVTVWRLDRAGTSMLIEDVACPVDKLADMTLDLVEMFKKFGYKDASCFGHALEGNLHLVFSQVRAACPSTSLYLPTSSLI
jgi:FAD/FMN-containing dehydrogenase